MSDARGNPSSAVRNLYVHFPFCRSKCRYCALYSRAGVSREARDAYVRRLAREIGTLGPDSGLATVYFGGGTPALCDLGPIFEALKPFLRDETEFTVELHPLDVTDGLLDALRAGGVNRISTGVQSLDDATLARMGRGYTADEARAAFARVKGRFDNAGIDLIVGYPGDPCDRFATLADWGLRHCSVYSLQNERGLADVPSDDWTLDRIRETARTLADVGLERYEISNYAEPGFECRHNLAVWNGEDYVGLGDGAHGRVGLLRTPSGERVTSEADHRERAIFRLRTRAGLETADDPGWRPALDRFVAEGLLVRDGTVYRLTPRGTEVCDTILMELV